MINNNLRAWNSDKLNELTDSFPIKKKQKMSELLEIFLRTLESSGPPKAFMISPTLRSTGFTFLCSLDPETDKNLYSPIKDFVLKWEGKDLADNDRHVNSMRTIS